MVGDASKRRTFLKAMGLTAASAMLPAGIGVSVASAAPAGAGGLGALELWLLDTGLTSLDTGLYESARQELADAVAARGDSLPY